MSVTDSIGALATGTYSVSRRASGSFTQGRYTPGTLALLTITASVQPVRGRDLRVLPEGQRAEDTRVVYTTTELRTRTDSTEPDRVSIGGEPFNVFRVEKWDAFGTTHYRAFVALVKPTGVLAEGAATESGDTVAGAGTVA